MIRHYRLLLVPLGFTSVILSRYGWGAVTAGWSYGVLCILYTLASEINAESKAIR